MPVPEIPRHQGQPARFSSSVRVRRRRTPEEELDAIMPTLKDRQCIASNAQGAGEPDRIVALREMTLREFIPTFVELVEKYSESGMRMQMDASNFLEGGRELRFEFGIGEYRMELLGTVTTEAIAFHETRYSPEVTGELVSGPMLRLRNLDCAAFRDFVCDRMMVLVRSMVRRR